MTKDEQKNIHVTSVLCSNETLDWYQKISPEIKGYKSNMLKNDGIPVNCHLQ